MMLIDSCEFFSGADTFVTAHIQHLRHSDSRKSKWSLSLALHIRIYFLSCYLLEIILKKRETSCIFQQNGSNRGISLYATIPPFPFSFSYNFAMPSAGSAISL